MIPLCSMHTHTTFCDGKNTAEEMVVGAIESGCTTLGFSGHSYMDIGGADEWVMKEHKLPQYVGEIKRLKEAYKEQIEIMLGIEQDYFSATSTSDFDYVIGSVHCVKKSGEYCFVDMSPQELKEAVGHLYGGNMMEMVKDYYALVADVVDRTNCDIIGHFDLVTKFNEKYALIDTDSKIYRDAAMDALNALIEKDRIFEINTGAISRGWRVTPYPQDFLLRRIAEKGARVIITSDSHSRDTILFGYEAAVEYAKSCGITSVCVFENGKAKSIGI